MFLRSAVRLGEGLEVKMEIGLLTGQTAAGAHPLVLTDLGDEQGVPRNH